MTYIISVVAVSVPTGNAVVASLFPKNVRDRIMEDVEEQLRENVNSKSIAKNLRLGALPRSELKNFLDDANTPGDGTVFDTKPIADLFLSTTISKRWSGCLWIVLAHVISH